MRKRRWVLLIPLFFIVVVLGVMYGWRLMRAEEHLKSFIIGQLQPLLGESCAIERVHISFSNVHLLRLTLSDPEHTFELSIDDLRIGFNPLHVLRYGPQSRAFSQDLFIKRPRLVLYPKNTQDSLRVPVEVQLRQQLERLKALHRVNRLSILDGEIDLTLQDGRTFNLVHHLEGWLSKTGQDKIDLRLNGALLDADHSSLALLAQIDLDSGRLAALRTTVKKVPLTHPLFASGDSAITVSAGLLDAELSYSPGGDGPLFHDLQGAIAVSGLAAALADSMLMLSQGDLALSVKRGNIYVEEATATINDARASLNGEVESWLTPRFNLALTMPETDLSRYNQILRLPAGPLRGMAHLRLALTGSLQEPVWMIHLHADRLRYRTLEFKSIAGSARWRRGCLSVHHLQATWREFDVDGQGEVHLTADSSRIDAALSIHGNALPLVQKYWPNPLRLARLDGVLRVSGALQKPQADGRLDLSLTGAIQDSIFLSHRMLLQGSLLRISPFMGAGNGMTGAVDWSKRPISFDLEIPAIIPWLSLLKPDLAARISALNLDSGIRASGNENDFSLSADFYQSASRRSLVTLQASLRRQAKTVQGEGTILFYPGSAAPLQGHFTVLRDSVRWNLRNLVVGDWITANLSLFQDQSLSGLCLVQKWPLQRLFAAHNTPLQGALDAELSLSGTVEKPVLRGQMRLDDLTCRQAGPYHMEGAFTWDTMHLNLQRLLVKAADENLLFANGAYHPGCDSLHFRLQGTLFDMAKLSPAFLPGRLPLAGQTTADIVVSGRRSDPEFSGFISIQQGSLYSIPFDDMRLDLGRSYARPGRSRRPGAPVINLQRLVVHRKGDFEVAAEGIYPLTTRDSLDIDMHGTGNFLSLLSNLNTYFVESSSSGNFNARLTGLWNRPRFRSAELTVTNGVMKFQTVVPKVTALTARLTFHPQNHFVSIDHFEGKIDGHTCRISNRLAAAEMCSRPLQNLDFSDYGVNLGVLTLETAPQGVPLNILGLMERGKYGFVRFKGRTEQERFYCAGPIERPLFRGLLEVSNLQFMFPFDETLDMGGSNVALKVLFSAEWDVAVRAVNEVRYVKFIPGGLDKVYANLKLEENLGDLEFFGQWNDSTFRINGEVRTTSGIIEYLDMNFTLEQGGARWDRSSLFPIVWGQARTTVTDSVGFASQIYLAVQTVDQTMDKKPVDDIARQEERLGRWDQIRFKLSSDNPNLGTTEAQLLASLGYSTATLQDKAVDVIGINTENYLLRPIYRPVERTLEQLFSFDYVRFSSRFTRNFLNANLGNNVDLTNRLLLLRSTKLVLGKYLSKNLFLQYTGQVEAGLEYRYQSRGVGLRHTLGLEYRVNPQVLLELEYDYDSLMLYNRDDKRIVLRHWFPL